LFKVVQIVKGQDGPCICDLFLNMLSPRLLWRIDNNVLSFNKLRELFCHLVKIGNIHISKAVYLAY